jgi:hypothetical protein
MDGLIKGIEYGKSLGCSAAFSRSDSSDNIASVITALQSVKKAAFTGDALNNYFRITVDQNGHFFIRWL